MSSIAELESFINKYRVLYDQHATRQLVDFQADFTRLKHYFGLKKVETEKLAREEAPDFNIFRLFTLEISELHHSRFLANLLDPEGNHGQSSLFLQSFLTHISNDLPSFAEITLNSHQGHWMVKAEEGISDGRMDIVVWNRLLGAFIVIENKIHAYEQPQQLKRYGDWLEHRRRDFPTQALIFLTLRGDKALTAEGSAYINMSYENLIVPWLSQILNQNPALPIRVKGTLLQYIDTIQLLSI